MAKERLQIENGDEAFVLAISCHQKSTKLAWEINRVLGCSLQAGTKLGDSIYFVNDINGHAYYSWHDTSQRVTFHLLGNLGTSKTLVPSMSQFDYFFVLTGLYNELNIERGVREIRNINSVLTAVPVTPPAIN